MRKRPLPGHLHFRNPVPVREVARPRCLQSRDTTLLRVVVSCKIIGTAMERMLSSATGEWKHATYDITPVCG